MIVSVCRVCSAFCLALVTQLFLLKPGGGFALKMVHIACDFISIIVLIGSTWGGVTC